MVASRERRKHPRLSLSVDVDATSENNFYAGRTRDISAGGLFIEGDLGLEPGAELALRLHLGEHRVQCQTEVAWVLAGDDGRVTGVGVRFTRLSAEARRHIQDFMRTRSPVPFDIDEPDPPRKGPPPLPKS
jgi:uncharacterized protein (TIGR02266 family)